MVFVVGTARPKAAIFVDLGNGTGVVIQNHNEYPEYDVIPDGMSATGFMVVEDVDEAQLEKMVELIQKRETLRQKVAEAEQEAQRIFGNMDSQAQMRLNNLQFTDPAAYNNHPFTKASEYFYYLLDQLDAVEQQFSDEFGDVAGAGSGSLNSFADIWGDGDNRSRYLSGIDNLTQTFLSLLQTKNHGIEETVNPLEILFVGGAFRLIARPVSTAAAESLEAELSQAGKQSATKALEEVAPRGAAVPRTGRIRELGKTIDQLSDTERQALRALQDDGYDIDILLEASMQGRHGEKTPEFIVHGMGRVDVLTPETLTTKAIARRIEKKVRGGQASSIAVVLPESFSTADMAKIGLRVRGKIVNGAPLPIDRIIFIRNGHPTVGY